MTTIVGGLRHRLIKDNLYSMINGSLAALGWFDSGRAHGPITFRGTPIMFDEQVPLNTLALSDEGYHAKQWELGGMMSEFTSDWWLDFYAENQSVGMHMIGDCKDLLDGRFASIGRSRPELDVYDLTQTTPPHIFSVEIVNTMVDRAHNIQKPWERYWYACSFQLLDYYATDADPNLILGL